ncbi:MAG TPA: signal peptidase I [Gammaproteobacteria bacterium]|nr:signal peptidase I [Gammaproteobacteria bacterium]
MSLNTIFALVLVLGTCITGVVWLIDAIAFAPRRREAYVAAHPEAAKEEATEAPADEAALPRKKQKKAKKMRPPEPIAVEYARSFFPVFLIVLVVRSFIVEPFHIPSGSMIPTLMIGDFVLVNKFDYGIRLPLSHAKIISIGEPQRGDVAVFRFPKNPNVDYIKRIVGVPGDHIEYRNETLYVNGKRVEDTPLGWYSGPHVAEARVGIEHLDGVDHKILTMPNVQGKEGSWVVPPHEYFAMGDNRDNSFDSRYWGFVPEKNLIGKAFIIWMNWDGYPSMPMWSRIGTAIK